MFQRIGAVQNVESASHKEQIEAANLQAAIRIATTRAFEIMAADLANGQLKYNRIIIIQNESGDTIHTLRFCELIGDAAMQSN